MMNTSAQCENITTPAGGNVSMVTDGTHTIAVYSCAVGSSLDGVAAPECQADGNWYADTPTCSKLNQIYAMSML